MSESTQFAFLLTFVAGFATVIGAFIAFFIKGANPKYLCLSLGFSAGVMIFIALSELFIESRHILVDRLGKEAGASLAVVSLLAGMVIMGLIDRFVPEEDNPHEMRDFKGMPDQPAQLKSTKVMRTGFLLAVGIGIHNFPEGIATFVSAIQDPKMGIAVAMAIALHNIPEGISVSIPIYYATGSRKQALLFASLSGISETVGAALAYTFLVFFLNQLVYGVILGTIAGFMVYLAFDELLPAAEEYGSHHLSLYGLLSGILVMALSLVML